MNLTLTASLDSSDFIYDAQVIQLTNARVSSLQMSGAAENGQPELSATFVYTAVKDTFTPVGSSGLPTTLVVATWNYRTNSAS